MNSYIPRDFLLIFGPDKFRLCYNIVYLYIDYIYYIYCKKFCRPKNNDNKVLGPRHLHCKLYYIRQETLFWFGAYLDTAFFCHNWL